ncbi:hypothetical protein P7K49_018977 [Saguinus oedipus]|uniref:Uncharacterized protein n=1 Tax=Saguinus oedipus TaxID=9490 RepID=A0ABQ9UW95_SAGOE|nr:hypothetical protein P7K49_018977 [Saguinus oedipus]
MLRITANTITSCGEDHNQGPSVSEITTKEQIMTERASRGFQPYRHGSIGSDSASSEINAMPCSPWGKEP